MRFTPHQGIYAYERTNRKLKAAERRLRLDREKFPLFAAEIAESQHTGGIARRARQSIRREPASEPRSRGSKLVARARRAARDRRTGSRRIHPLLGSLQMSRQRVLFADQIGRAHVCTPVTNAHLVCRLLL